MSAVSLTDAKTFLNRSGVADSTLDDDELGDMLDRATAILARLVGPLEPETVTDEVHTGPGPILLKRWPVISVTSATSSNVAVTDLDLDTDAGLVHGTFGKTARETLVTYIAGRQALPADLEAAVLELLLHLVKTQRVPGRRAFGGEPDERTLQGVSSYMLPYRVQTLIEPHMVPRVA